jgi:hypothetical protein
MLVANPLLEQFIEATREKTPTSKGDVKSAIYCGAH